MRAWLQGDLSGVDARAELGLVREVAERAIAEGEDLAPLLTALAELDPVACAELVAGPRALVALQILPLVLELAAVLAPVLPPQALAQRLLSLYPDHRDPVLMWALHANPGSAWPWRLDRSERPLGMAALRLRSDLDPEVAVVEALARGLTDAVVARAASGHLPAHRAPVPPPHPGAARRRCLARRGSRRSPARVGGCLVGPGSRSVGRCGRRPRPDRRRPRSTRPGVRGHP